MRVAISNRRSNVCASKTDTIFDHMLHIEHAIANQHNQAENELKKHHEYYTTR